MKSKLISLMVSNGNTDRFNDTINKILNEIEDEGGVITDRKYTCTGVRGEYSAEYWHNVLLFYYITPTRKVLTEKR